MVEAEWLEAKNFDLLRKVEKIVENHNINSTKKGKQFMYHDIELFMYNMPKKIQ